MNNKHTKETLEPVIQSSTQWAEVCRKLNVKPFTGAQTHLKNRAIKFNIDFSHFGGMGRKGKARNKKYTLNRYLTKNSNHRSAMIRTRLIEEKLKELKCEKCHITEWQGQLAPLELDHIDNDHWNNELNNLMILCANCHSLKHRPNGEMQTRTA